MITTKNSAIAEKVLYTLIDILSRKSSSHYSLILMDTFIGKLKSKYGFLEYINIKTTSFSSNSKIISIDTKINSIEPKELGKAIQELVLYINKTLGCGKEQFIGEFKGYLGYSFYLKLQNMGVKL